MISDAAVLLIAIINDINKRAGQYIYYHGLLKTNKTQQKNATPFKTP